MIYSNDDPAAILAMERDRTGNYGDDYYEDDDTQRCPICGAYAPEHFYIDNDEECVGCSECVYKTDILY